MTSLTKSQAKAINASRVMGWLRAQQRVGGSVDVKWHGSSNGYYSEEVDFEFYEEPRQ